MPEEGCSIVYAGHQGRDRESSNPASSSWESEANLTHSRDQRKPGKAPIAAETTTDGPRRCRMTVWPVNHRVRQIPSA